MEVAAYCKTAGNCDYSPTERMCEGLNKVGVPHDPKWRTFILYSRTLESYSYLTREQRAQLQSLILQVIRERDYSEEKFLQLMQENQKIVSRPYIDKLNGAVKETEVLIKEFQGILKSRRGDISGLGNQTINAVEQGQEPHELLATLRQAFKDIVTTLLHDEERLENMCLTDALTGLNNRRALDEYLQKILSQKPENIRTCFFLLLDIDFFKKFNDTYGHRIGDQALATVAKNIRDHLQEHDLNSFAARYGGEEFGVVLTNCLAEDATGFAESLRQRIGGYNFVIRDSNGKVITQEIRITVSIGLAELDRSRSTSQQILISTLVDLADAGLYAAKRNGRNQVARGI